jgi:putative thiamine transport system permease protein
MVPPKFPVPLSMNRPLTWSWAPPVVALSVVGCVFFPLLPGMLDEFMPLADLAIWRQLLMSPLLPQALVGTLVSTLLSTGLALVLALAIVVRVYPGQYWIRAQRRLPLFLSLPHVAFAIGLFFLFAPAGWFSRLIAILWGWDIPPDWIMVRDDSGLSLGVALAIRESWFLLWVIGAVVDDTCFHRQMSMVRCLGYSQWQAWRFVLLPQLFPRIVWPVTAVLAYGLSVVDMAMILGPTNPPTLAVLIWQWLNDYDTGRYLMGVAGAVLLVVLLISLVLVVRIVWYFSMLILCRSSGKRTTANQSTHQTWLIHSLWGIGYSTVLVLLVWSCAKSWFYPDVLPTGFTVRNWIEVDYTPFFTSLWMALSVSILSVMMGLVWLEWGPRYFNTWVYLPLILPAMPLVIAQYSVLLRWQLDSTAVGVIWSHLLWGFPYAVLILVGPYRAVDSRYLLIARTLGYSPLFACWRVKWPILVKPVCAATAVAFSVSIAQYLPTLFAGGGRWITVTTEAVNLSAGGSRQIVAVYAVLQLLLPLCMFILAIRIPQWYTRNHKGVI